MTKFKFLDYSLPTDKFSLAIRQLHVSVLPEFLPCRSEERVKVLLKELNLIQLICLNWNLFYGWRKTDDCAGIQHFW